MILVALIAGAWSPHIKSWNPNMTVAKAVSMSIEWHNDKFAAHDSQESPFVDFAIYATPEQCNSAMAALDWPLVSTNNNEMQWFVAISLAGTTNTIDMVSIDNQSGINHEWHFTTQASPVVVDKNKCDIMQIINEVESRKFVPTAFIYLINFNMPEKVNKVISAITNTYGDVEVDADGEWYVAKTNYERPTYHTIGFFTNTGDSIFRQVVIGY